MTAYTSPAGAMSAATYDGNGIRTAATFTPAGQGATTQNYTWDTRGQVPNLLMDSTSAYIYTTPGTPAEQVSLATGTLSYLSADSLGSVRGMISGTGALTATTSYDAWGNPQTTGGLTAYTPFGYAGAYTDPTGLTYLINRYYDAQTAQFTSVDPLVSTTLAPYGYAAGNPVTGTDPTGLMNQDAPGGGTTPKQAAALTRVAEQILSNSSPAPVQYPQYYPKPRPKPATQHCGGFWGFVCKATHWVGHEIHQHWKGIVKTTLAAAAVGLTIVNVAQLGLDPLTDGAEAADIGALAAEEGASAAEDAASEEAAAEEEAASCGGMSFTAGTKVLLASGMAIPISQLKRGDKVLATNTKTGKTQAEPVTAVLLHHDINLYNLKIRAAHRTAVIQTTRTHKFWDITQDKWIRAAKLKHGDKLRTSDGTTATVARGYAPKQHTGWMWDISVPGGDDHDFYIDTRVATILVHNCSSPNQMQRQVERGQAPRGVERVDTANPGTDDAQAHIHFNDWRSTLNQDGTWGHGDGSDSNLTGKMIRWLTDNGWGVPDE